MTKFTLADIEIEGFRGINKQVTLRFSNKCTTIFAPNGMGKTSILGAIEWCLFGDLKYQEKENLTNDELVNINHRAGRARVRLTLTDQKGTYVIERERGIRKKGSDVTMTFPDNHVVAGSEAEASIFRLTGLTFDDFYRAVFLHQESVRGLLTEEPRIRNEALDRLFGLDKIRSILLSIPMKVTVDAMVKLDQEKSKLTDRISGASEQIESERRKRIDEAVAVGYQESDLNLQTAAHELSNAASQLNILTKDSGQDGLEPPIVNELQDIDRSIKKMKQHIRDIRASGSVNQLNEKLVQRQFKIKQLHKSFDDATQRCQTTKRTVNEYRIKFGSVEEIDTRISDLKKSKQDSQLKLKDKNLQNRLLMDAIDYLNSVPVSNLCPVCGESKDTKVLIDDLQTKVVGQFKIEINQLNTSIQKTAEEIDSMTDARRQLTQLLTEERGASEENEKVIAEIKTTIKDTSSSTDPLVILQTATERNNKEIELMTKSAEIREKGLADCELVLDRIKTISKFMDIDEQFIKLQDKIEQETGEGYEKELGELMAMQTSLDSIARTLNKVATQQAEDLITQSHDEISRYYGLLCNHPLFDGIRIDVGTKLSNMIEKNSYSIHAYSSKKGLDTLACSRLSTAQMNCVALSLYLALSKILPHGLGFVILDDPSQNLDSEHKEALCKLLEEIMEDSQLIIASHDSEIQSNFDKTLDKNESTGYLLEWSPIDGTKVNPIW